MNQQQIDLLRDAAVSLEKSNLQMAHDLMAMAYTNRPQGLFIKHKLERYQQKLNSSAKIKELLESGELAIIPAGFRCYTKMNILKNLDFKQASLPFDSGFFSPFSVASVLKNKRIELKYSDKDNDTHNVCIKLENHIDENLGKGIKFKKSTYSEIDSLIIDKKQNDISRYLDATFGFYTLDNKNKFVLAHYNWHPFANKTKEGTSYDSSKNINNINTILNKRIERMFEMCKKATYVVFAFGEFQNYKYMAIDNDIYDLEDFNTLSETVTEIFGDKCIVTNMSEINTTNKLLKKIGVKIS